MASFWRSRASVPGEVTGGLGGAAAQAQGRRREASGTAHDPALAARLRAEDAAAARPLPPKVRHRRLLPSRPHSDADWTQGPRTHSPTAAAAAAGRGLSIAPQQQFSSKVALAAEAEPCVRPPALIGPCGFETRQSEGRDSGTTGKGPLRSVFPLEPAPRGPWFGRTAPPWWGEAVGPAGWRLRAPGLPRGEASPSVPLFLSPPRSTDLRRIRPPDRGNSGARQRGAAGHGLRAQAFSAALWVLF